MIAGQKPKSAALKLVIGNPGGRPIHPEPQSPAIGGPPRHLPAAHRKVWRELAREAPEGVLKRADGMVLEIATALVIRFRSDPLAASPAMLAQLRQCLGELGMTMSARARISVAPPATVDPFAGF